MHCKIEHIPSVSAVYYALLKCGYSFHTFERQPDLIRAVENRVRTENVPSFFSEVRQNTCGVYPFWPRAFILEAATFFLSADLKGYSDFDALKSRILSAENISCQEKGEALWNWLRGFPDALAAVMHGEGFRAYLEWEKEWIREQNIRYADELRRLDGLLRRCLKTYDPPCRKIRIVLDPIKCVYASDFHFSGDSFIITAGELRIASVVHEYLHTIVHPLLGRIRTERKEYPGIDGSYYLDRSERGYRNAFEEYAVRSLTDALMREECPADLSAFLQSIN